MTRIHLRAGLLGLSLIMVTTGAIPADPEGAPEVVTVRMVDKSATEYVFEPADITVAPGTIIRFVLAGTIPHNVEFKDGPDGTDLGGSKLGPFLLTKGDVYEITIDDRFALGEHKYVCTPHEMMGMKGTIIVQSEDTTGR